jgi:cation transport ATPase
MGKKKRERRKEKRKKKRKEKEEKRKKKRKEKEINSNIKMEYYDWLIISSALILIGFLTLLGLALLETTFRDVHKWVLWFSVGGVIIFSIITGLLIWYFHGKDKVKKKVIPVSVNMEKESLRGEPIEYKDQILVNNLKSEV